MAESFEFVAQLLHGIVALTDIVVDEREAAVADIHALIDPHDDSDAIRQQGLVCATGVDFHDGLETSVPVDQVDEDHRDSLVGHEKNPMTLVME